jgi:acyl carrier protein
MEYEVTATETRIAGMWSEFIATPSAIQPTDNFFALGGDSLAMTMLLFRIKEELGVDLPPGALLEAPELRAFCAQIDSAAGTAG